MNIYLAGRYGRRCELAGYAQDLRDAGHLVTSRWLLGKHEMLDEKPSHDEAMRFALEDIQDLEAADVLAAFTESPGYQVGRGSGGRHVEFGYALAKCMEVCVIGHRENVFCHLPSVHHFNSFLDFMRHVDDRKKPRRMKANLDSYWPEHRMDHDEQIGCSSIPRCQPIYDSNEHKELYGKCTDDSQQAD